MRTFIKSAVLSTAFGGLFVSAHSLLAQRIEGDGSFRTGPSVDIGGTSIGTFMESTPRGRTNEYGPAVTNQFGWLESSTALGVSIPIGGGNRAASNVPQESLDEAFDPYVNLLLLGKAWAELDSGLLTDVALQLAEGERVLQRPHKSGITAKQLLAKAAKLAGSLQDSSTLQRLAKVAEAGAIDELNAQLQAANKLAGASRSTDVRLNVPLETVDLQTIITLKGMLESIKSAELAGDVDLLGALRSQLQESPELGEEHQTVIRGLIDSAEAGIPKERAPEDDLLGKLAAASRRVEPEQILEGALSGAVERALYFELRDLRSEFSNNWGNKISVWTGKTKVVWQGIRSRVERINDELDHGLWTRGWVRIENAADELDVKFRNFRKTPGKLQLRFQIYVRAMFRGQIEARQYNHGVGLWRATSNGRARGHIFLNMRVHIDGTELRWEAENVDIKYSDVAVDRVGHVGGEAARVVGNAFTGAIKKWFADKEREAVSKAKRAVDQAIRGSRPIRNDLARVIKML